MVPDMAPAAGPERPVDRDRRAALHSHSLPAPVLRMRAIRAVWSQETRL